MLLIILTQRHKKATIFGALLTIFIKGTEMIKHTITFLLIAFSSFATADDWASIASTPGYGRIEIVSDYLLFSSAKSFDAKIPKLVKEGSSISIFYKQDDKVVTREFVVAGISTKGELCRLHSELPSRFSSSPSDTIYVKPCRYK